VCVANIVDPQTQHLDLGGLVTFSGSLLLLVLALLRGSDKGWSSSLILGLFAAAAVLLAAFVAVELRQQRAMFDLSLFRNRAFCGVSIGAGMFAAFPYLTLYLQNLLGYSPLQGGVRLLPATVFVFLVPIAARRFASGLAAGLLLGSGMALVAGGLAVMGRISDHSRWTVLLPGLILVGIGIGLANPAIAHIALAVVAPNRSGMASGISNTFRIGGVATGVAALGAVLQHSVRNNAVIASGPRAAGTGAAFDAAHHAFVSGTHDLVLVGAATAAVGALAAFALIRGV
jgi:hypothetical protein